MKMNNRFNILGFSILLLLFASCHSSKNLQKDLQYFQSDLDYDLTTPIYKNEINKVVYLDFIDHSNMDYFTTVEKKKAVFVPLIFYNYSKSKFKITLGEKSLSLTYREFLTDALLAECNRSTCFNLKNNYEENTNQNYVLSIKILDNKTSSIIEKKESYIFIPTGNDDDIDLDWNNNKIKDVNTYLLLSVSLSKDKQILLEKTFSTHFELPYFTKQSNIHESCLSAMTESLSYATKRIIEDISTHIHLLMLTQ